MQKTISNEIKIRFVDDGFRPYFEDDKEPRQIYRVFISYNGKKTSFTFGDSLQNGYDGKTPESNPEEYRQTILDCLVSDSYTPENFNEFCSEYGYNEDSRKAFKTYKRVIKQAEKINKVFSTEDLEALYNEVNN